MFYLKTLLLYPQIVQIIVVPMDCVYQTQAGAMRRMTVEMEVMSMTVVRWDPGGGRGGRGGGGCVCVGEPIPVVL